MGRGRALAFVSCPARMKAGTHTPFSFSSIKTNCLFFNFPFDVIQFFFSSSVYLSSWALPAIVYVRVYEAQTERRTEDE